MLKRIALVLCLFLILVPFTAAYAQQTPQPVLDAIAALSQKVGRNLTLADMAAWTWEQKIFPDTSMGCPLPGQTYPQTSTSGYIIGLTYNGVAYDYRVSANRQVVFLCSPGGGAPGGTGSGGVGVPTPVPTIVPNAPVVVVPPPIGTAPCVGGMPTRLAVGMQGQAITTGSVNIRATPGATGQVAGLLLPNGIFTVTGGPRCMDMSQTWWQISYKTQSGVVTNGWVMEGDAPTNDYWLQPFGTVPTVTNPTGPTVSSGSPVNRIAPANAAQLRVYAQTPLLGTYAAAVPQEVDPVALIVDTSRQVKLYPGATAGSLLTLGSGATEKIAAVALGSGSYRVATADLVSGNAAIANLIVYTLVPGPAAPAVSGQVGVQVPWVNSLAFSPNGSRLAAGTGRLPGGDPSVTNGVWVWDTTTNTQIAGLPFNAPVAGVTFTPDGSVLAIATADNTVHLWALSTNVELAALPSTVKPTPGTIIAFNPTGTQLAVVGNDAVRVWDMATRTVRFTLAPNGGQYPRQVAFSPDGSLLAVSGDNGTTGSYLSVWDMNSGVQLMNQLDSQNSLPAITFNIDGTKLIVVGSQWTIWGAP